VVLLLLLGTDTSFVCSVPVDLVKIGQMSPQAEVPSITAIRAGSIGQIIASCDYAIVLDSTKAVLDGMTDLVFVLINLYLSSSNG
jgi:hypothetical protein